MKQSVKVLNKGEGWRTFQDFIQHAQRVYGKSVLNEKETERFILEKLKSKGLSKKAVVCYINWCDNGFFSQQEIADKLGIARTTVEMYIHRLRKIWPFLPGHPHARGQRGAKKRPHQFQNMTKLKKKVLHKVKIRESW